MWSWSALTDAAETWCPNNVDFWPSYQTYALAFDMSTRRLMADWSLDVSYLCCRDYCSWVYVKVKSDLWTLSLASRSASWQRWSSTFMLCFSSDNCCSRNSRGRVCGGEAWPSGEMSSQDSEGGGARRSWELWDEKNRSFVSELVGTRCQHLHSSTTVDSEVTFVAAWDPECPHCVTNRGEYDIISILRYHDILRYST